MSVIERTPSTFAPLFPVTQSRWMPAHSIFSRASLNGVSIVTFSGARNSPPLRFFRYSATGSMRSSRLSVVSPRMSEPERVATRLPCASTTGTAETVQSMTHPPCQSFRNAVRAVCVSLTVIIISFFSTSPSVPIDWDMHRASPACALIFEPMKRIRSDWAMRWTGSGFGFGCGLGSAVVLVARRLMRARCTPCDSRSASTCSSSSSQYSRVYSLIPIRWLTGLSSTPLLLVRTALMSSTVGSFSASKRSDQGVKTTPTTRSKVDTMPFILPSGVQTGMDKTLRWSSSLRAASTVACSGIVNSSPFFRPPLSMNSTKSATFRPSKNVIFLASSSCGTLANGLAGSPASFSAISGRGQPRRMNAWQSFQIFLTSSTLPSLFTCSM
mmetsp:Transcript_27928/g.54418  ORF Transcript_27928/g.54418 Transcript_27928/m.54418 type:complete len:384 (+) Transcript_27928:287-1438(+)